MLFLYVVVKRVFYQMFLKYNVIKNEWEFVVSLLIYALKKVMSLLISGGESPRGCIDPLADLLLILNKKYCDNLSRWLYQTISINGFPSPKASVDNKQHFVKSVLKWVKFDNKSLKI